MAAVVRVQAEREESRAEQRRGGIGDGD